MDSTSSLLPEDAVYLRAQRLRAVRDAVSEVFGGSKRMDLVDPAELQRIVRMVRAAISAVPDAYGTIVGGLAIQELGYMRFTEDVDVVIDAQHYSQVLDHLRQNGFVLKGDFILTKADSGVILDVLKEGQTMKDSRFPVPHPAELGPNRGFATIAGIIRMKLDTRRLKDQADIVELLKKRVEQFGSIRAQIPEVLHPDFDRACEQARKELA
jgi:hypothetical protein